MGFGSVFLRLFFVVFIIDYPAKRTVIFLRSPIKAILLDLSIT